MADLKQSTAYTRMFMMIDSTDHITGKTGLTVTLTLSKAGAAFGAAGGAVTEVSNGWYKVALNTTDTGTLGDLAYHATATGADPTDFVDQVRARTVDDLTFPNVSGRGIDVDATGGVEITADQNVNVNKWLTATPDALSSGKVPADLKLWLAAAPAALSTSGYVQAMLLRWLTDNAAGTPNALATNRVDAKVGAMDADVINSGVIAVDSIGASELAASAADEIAAKILLNPANLLLTYGNGDVEVQVNNDKSGYTLSPAAIDAILDDPIEGVLTLREAIRIILAAAAAKADGFPSGPVHYRDQADTKNRITATVDADGNRTAVTVDGT